ncbi:MAG TPA: hypothetical protein VLA16_09795 [Ideonella sp.]|nr:hypothetical protein [Ideonella sp.]
MKIRQPLVCALVFAGFMAAGVQASAQSVKVKCTTGNGRSTAEVEGFQLVPGWYTSVLTSDKGANQAQSDREYAERDDDDDANDEDVDFEFDSKESEIRDGDTRIAPNFVVNQKVVAVLKDSSGTEVARSSAKCKAR